MLVNQYKSILKVGVVHDEYQESYQYHRLYDWIFNANICVSSKFRAKPRAELYSAFFTLCVKRNESLATSCNVVLECFDIVMGR